MIGVSGPYKAEGVWKDCIAWVFVFLIVVYVSWLVLDWTVR